MFYYSTRVIILCIRVYNTTPKFSFDIFLKNNPTRNLLGVATKLDLDGFETHAVSDNINNVMNVDPPDIFDAHAEARCKGTRQIATNP